MNRSAGPWWRAFTKHHWFVFTAASLAWFFDCLDSQFFNLARDAAMDDLVGDKGRAMILAPYTTSVFLIGWAVGGLIFGSLGDRYGRARILTITVLLYSGFTGLSAFSTSFLDFCIYRFLTGCGVGGVFGLAVALVADTVPGHTRAPALGLLQSLATWGNILAGLIGMGIAMLAARHLLPFGLKPWQAIFLVGALPAFLCVFLLKRLPEPEKWCRARDAGRLSGVQAGSYGVLLGRAPWARHAWLGLVLCSAGIIGYWGIGNFHPRIVGSIVADHLAASGVGPERLASEQAFWRSVGLLLQNVGGFLGMGEKDVAVNTQAVQMVQDGTNAKRLVVDASRDALNAAPAYDRSARRYVPAASTPVADNATGTTTLPTGKSGMVDCTNTINAADPACTNQTQQQ